MFHSGSDEERRISQRRRHTRQQRIELDGDFTRLLHRSDDPSRTDAALLRKKNEPPGTNAAVAAPTLTTSSIKHASSTSTPSAQSAPHDATTSKRRVASRLFEDPIGGFPSVSFERHRSDPYGDLFCRDSVTLTILRGFAESGQLHSHVSACVYERLSLHLQIGNSANVDDNARDEEGLRFYSPSSNRLDLSVLLYVPLHQIVGVSRSSNDDDTASLIRHQDELWIEVVHPVSANKGVAAAPQVISMSVATGSAPVTAKLESLLLSSLGRFRALRRAEVVAAAPSSRSLAKEMLASLRTLQQQTGRLLSDLRSEVSAEASSKASTGLVDEGDVKGDPHDAWVQRTIVRRRNLGDAQSELQAIQIRRQLRADRVSRLISGRVDFSTHTTAPSPEPPATLQRMRSERRSSNTVLPRASPSIASPVGGDRYMCKHCGENLPDRVEQRDHQQVCAYRMVRCRKCGELVRAKGFTKHRTSNACRGKPRGSSSLQKRPSSVSEVSSSSMEEIGSDAMSNSTRDSSASRRRKTPAHLRELPRSDTGRWEDLRPTSATERRPSSTSSRHYIPLSQEALRRHNSSLSPTRKLSEASLGRAGSLRRVGSTLEDVATRCVHCGRSAPSSHPARCAYRPVQCAVCGDEVRARDAMAHADLHRR
jgi:hypothetical protein